MRLTGGPGGGKRFADPPGLGSHWNVTPPDDLILLEDSGQTRPPVRQHGDPRCRAVDADGACAAAPP
jgi:hypothetical protein